MELSIINHIRKMTGQSSRLSVGIGDDAAVLNTQNSQTVMTVDLLTEGIDFISNSVLPHFIGRKALAVSLSDLAAMGAIPHSILVAVAIPKKLSVGYAGNLMQGIIDLANKYDVAVAGGDTNTWSQGLVISVTAVGTIGPHGILCRSTAKEGDWIMATGRFGGSFLRRQFLFEPRIAEIHALMDRYPIHAAIDVSDGLALDLSRMAKESHLGFILDDLAIPIHPDVYECYNLFDAVRSTEFSDKEEAKSYMETVLFPFTFTAETVLEQIYGMVLYLSEINKKRPPMNLSNPHLESALTDGEDFELLLAVSPDVGQAMLNEKPLDAFHVELTKIGEFCSEKNGFIHRNSTGNCLPLTNLGGFIH